MSILSKLLGHSTPFDLLMLHHSKVLKCVDLAKPLLVAALNSRRDEMKRIADEIFRLEHEADTIKNQIRDHLPKALLLPVARTDLLAYLREQDSLADKAEDLASMVTMRPFQLPADWNPEEFTQQMSTLLDYSLGAVRQASGMLYQFDELRKKGFSGDIIGQLRQEVGEVGYLEWKVDKEQFKLVQRVLGINQPDWPFAASWVLLGIIRAISKLADHAESMGDYMRLMVAD